MLDPGQATKNSYRQRQVLECLRTELKEWLLSLDGPIPLIPEPGPPTENGDRRQRKVREWLRTKLTQLLLSFNGATPTVPAPGQPTNRGDDQRHVPDCLRSELKELILSLFRIAADGSRVLVLLVFEALTLFVLKYGPFEDYRPAIEPVLLRAAWGIVCIFYFASIALFITQFFNHLREQKPGTAGSVAALVSVVALAGGSMYFVPAVPRDHSASSRSEPPSAQSSRPEQAPAAALGVTWLNLPFPTRGALNGKQAPPPSLVWQKGQVGLLLGIFVAIQKNVVYQWELDDDGHCENLAVPDSGYVWIYVRRSKLGNGMHHLIIHRIAKGERAPDLYDFLTIDAY